LAKSAIDRREGNGHFVSIRSDGVLTASAYTHSNRAHFADRRLHSGQSIRPSGIAALAGNAAICIAARLLLNPELPILGPQMEIRHVLDQTSCVLSFTDYI
jgi:hypothetical protein